jgi:uncharacterized protein
MLNASDFKPVSLSDRPIFVEHYERFPQVHSDNTFTNMICWNHYAHYRYAHAQENIVLSSTIDEKTRYRAPIGPRNPELLEDIIRLATSSEDDYPLIILDPENKDWISELYPELNLIPKRNYFDYIYNASDLAELSGKKYQTIRKQLNQFQRTCSPIVEAIKEDNLAEIQEFLDQWCEWKGCEGDMLLANEKEAVFFAISHFAELELSGLAIRSEGKIGAMAVFEGLNKDTAVVHFEKGLPDCKGIYRAVNSETAKLLVGKYTYINRESDMGVEGMREAKTRYHPDHMVEVYLAKKEDLNKLLS